MSIEGPRPIYEGIQAVDLTSQGHVFKPEEAFQLACEVNKLLASEVQIKLEVYPFLDKRYLTQLRDVAHKRNIFLPIPGGVTAKDLKKWEKQYNVDVERIHLPFDYDNVELAYGLAKSTIQNKSLDPRKNRQIGWIMTLGGASNMHGVQLAQELEAGINAHANIITGLADEGKLERIRGTVPYIVTEVEQRHRTPLLRNADAFSIPTEAINHIVEKYDLDGILLGLDHLDPSVNLSKQLQDPKVRQYTTALHIGGDDDHGIIAVGNRQFTGQLENFAKTPFANPVRAALDYNPFEMKKLSGNQQIELVKNTIIWIMRSQGFEDKTFIKK